MATICDGVIKKEVAERVGFEPTRAGRQAEA